MEKVSITLSMRGGRELFSPCWLPALLPCRDSLLATAQRAKVTPSQHENTFSCRPGGGFLLVFYSVVHRRGHPVTSFLLWSERESQVASCLWFCRNSPLWWPLSTPLMQVMEEEHFSVSRRGAVPWESVAPWESRQHQGKESRRKARFQSSEPLQRTPLLKAILIKGEVLGEKAWWFSHASGTPGWKTFSLAILRAPLWSTHCAAGIKLLEILVRHLDKYLRE